MLLIVYLVGHADGKIRGLKMQKSEYVEYFANEEIDEIIKTGLKNGELVIVGYAEDGEPIIDLAEGTRKILERIRMSGGFDVTDKLQ